MWLTSSDPASLLERETPLAHCTGYASLDPTGAEDKEAAHQNSYVLAYARFELSVTTRG